MDYEKKYKEALEYAHYLINERCKQGTDGSFHRVDLQKMFPELKESENERIRKALMQNLKERFGTKGNMGDGLDMPDVLAWLEKQGGIDNCPLEYSTNTVMTDSKKNQVKPKFKVGDIIEYVGERKELIDGKYEIKEIGNDFYVTTSGVIIPFKFEEYYINKTEPKFKVENGKWYICTQTFVLRGKIIVIKGQVYQAQENGAIKGEEGCLFVDKHDGKASEYFRLWTIQDAKDGDVLITDRYPVGISIFIFKSYRPSVFGIDCYCFLNSKGVFHKNCTTYYHRHDVKIYPATEEQRDQLEKAMKDAGYVLDAKTKELKKIEQETSEGIEIPFGASDSELQEATYYIPKGFHAEIEEDKVVIKKGEQKPAEWSKEDELMCNNLIQTLIRLSAESHTISTSPCYCYPKEIDWLKSLKDRAFPQPKVEWSEEDRKNLQGIIDEIEANKNNAPDYDLATYDRFLDWLKYKVGQ